MAESNISHNRHIDQGQWHGEPRKSFAISGKIMLSAIVILFAVIVFMLLLHVYARWYLLTIRRREIRRRRRSHRRTHLVFYANNHDGPAPAVEAVNRGLDASVLNSLPIFLYSSNTHPEMPECAVCLSEFEENEKSRLLPKCNHSFHIECIDMWFQSHSTCPLCRSPVEAVENEVKTAENILPEVVLSVSEPVDASLPPVSNSGSCAACRHVEDIKASSSLAARRKGVEMVGVTVEVPTRNVSEGEFGTSSPASQSFRSPGSRLLSLKRLLTMNRITGYATSSGSGGAELDVESGKDESTQGQTRPQTPR